MGHSAPTFIGVAGHNWMGAVYASVCHALVILRVGLLGELVERQEGLKEPPIPQKQLWK